MYQRFFFDNKLDWAPTVDNVWKDSLQTLHFDLQKLTVLCWSSRYLIEEKKTFARVTCTL
jgi:hypothetical protein